MGTADDIRIRDLGPADTEAVVEIALLAWEPIYASYRRILGEELYAAAYPDWRKEKERHIRDGMADPRGTVSVAETDGRVVGFVSFYRKGSGIGEIGNNAVHPDFQNRGIATRLYRHALDRLKQAGMRFVQVGTGLDPGHAPARRAYEKAGFDRGVPGITYYREL